MTEARQLLDKIKLSSSQVAKALGVTYQTIYNWRVGKNTPTRKNLERLRDLACPRYEVSLVVHDQGIDPT